MSTSLFPTDTAQTIGVVPSPSGWSNATLKQLSLTRGSGAVTKTINTSASLAVVPASSGNISPVPVNSATSVGSGSTAEGSLGGDIIWVSNAINAVTISGTINVAAHALESNAMANYACQAHVYKIDGATGATTCIGRGGSGTELGTIETTASITITPTSTAFSTGDYIAVRYFYGSATSTTSASGFTASFRYNGTVAASGDCFFTFAESITESSGGGSVKTLSGTANATASVGATVGKTAVLSPSVAASATATASVVKTAVLRPAVSATSSATLSVVKTAALAPGVNAISTVSGSLIRTASLGPTVNGAAVVTATVANGAIQASTVSARATVNGTLNRVYSFSPSASATSTVSGSVFKVSVLAPSANATATVSATLVRNRSVVPTISGTATVSIGLVATRIFSGTANATATVTATLADIPAGGGGGAIDQVPIPVWVSSHYYYH